MEPQQKPHQEPESAYQSIKEELLQMGFLAERIQEALASRKTKEEAIDYLINYEQKKQAEQKMGNQNEDDFEDEEQDYKMIFVVRMDLKLALHKIAELVATATLKAYKQIEALIEVDEAKECAFFEWTEGGQRKIVVKAVSEQDLFDVAQKAKLANINYVLIHQLPSNLKFQKVQSIPSKKPAKRQGKNEVKAIAKEQKQQTKESKPLSQQASNLISASQVSNEVKVEQVVEKPEGQKMKEEVVNKEILVLGAFGPAAESEIDPITKHFKLL